MQDPDARGTMRGCTRTNTAQWLWSGAGTAPSLPPQPQNPSLFHRLPLAPTTFFSQPLFKMAPAHLETANWTAGFWFAFGTHHQLDGNSGASEGLGHDDVCWWALELVSSDDAPACSCASEGGGGVLLVMELYQLKICKWISCWLVGLVLLFRFLVFCTHQNYPTGLSDLLDLCIFDLVVLC